MPTQYELGQKKALSLIKEMLFFGKAKKRSKFGSFIGGGEATQLAGF